MSVTKGFDMTTKELYRDLTDLEFKVFSYINLYNEGREFKRVPAAEHIADKIDKSKRTVERAVAGLKTKGVIR
jgi:predicted transcriptional regulator